MTTLAPLGQIAPVPQISPLQLSGRQKAAIVVRALLTEGVEFSLTELPEGLQTQLIHDMAQMRAVSHETVSAVLTEFLDLVDAIGLSFPGGMAGTLQALDGKLSQSTLNRLRTQVGMARSGDPWQQIAALPNEALIPTLETESTEVAAVILSKLKVAQAAELLALLPGPVARRITYAVSQTAQITPEAVERIGLSVAAQLAATPPRAFDAEPVARVGAILNFSPAATRDQVLEGLQETDQGFAAEVKKAIFTFENIPARLEARDVPKVLKGVDATALATALAAGRQGSHATVSDFLLGAMSQRLAQQIEEQMEDMQAIPEAEGEAAMGEIVAEIRRLAEDGEITLNSEPDPEG